jgi:hypothetical protein
MHNKCLDKLQQHRSLAAGPPRPVQRAACFKVQCSLGSSPQQPRSSKPLQSAAQLGEQHQRLSRLVALSSKLPNQADQLWDPSDRNEEKLIVLEKPATRSISDLDYLSVSTVSLVLARWPARRGSTLTCYASAAAPAALVVLLCVCRSC